MNAVDEYRDPENGQWKTSLADVAIAELEAKLAESNEMYKAAMALWAAETGRRKQGEAELAAAHEVISHFQQGCEP